MFGPILAMASSPEWQRDTAMAVLVILALATVFVRTTASKGKGEKNRRLGLGLLAFLGGPLLGAWLAGVYHALSGIHPMDVADTYLNFIGIGVVAGSLLGLFFASTSLLYSNGPETSPRKPNP